MKYYAQPYSVVMDLKPSQFYGLLDEIERIEKPSDDDTTDMPRKQKGGPMPKLESEAQFRSFFGF